MLQRQKDSRLTTTCQFFFQGIGSQGTFLATRDINMIEQKLSPMFSTRKKLASCRDIVNNRCAPHRNLSKFFRIQYRSRLKCPDLFQNYLSHYDTKCEFHSCLKYEFFETRFQNRNRNIIGTHVLFLQSTYFYGIKQRNLFFILLYVIIRKNRKMKYFLTLKSDCCFPANRTQICCARALLNNFNVLRKL